jgi:hypothetical protein
MDCDLKVLKVLLIQCHTPPTWFGNVFIFGPCCTLNFVLSIYPFYHVLTLILSSMLGLSKQITSIFKETLFLLQMNA